MLQNTFTAIDNEFFEFGVDCDEIYTTNGCGLWSEAVKDVRVTSMGIVIGLTEEDGCGDFAVCYDEATWDNNTDGLIYTDSAFLANVRDKVRDVLVQLNVDGDVANALVGDITYSEQGMQDDGRVSCDAYMLANYLRTLYTKQLVTA